MEQSKTKQNKTVNRLKIAYYFTMTVTILLTVAVIASMIQGKNVLLFMGWIILILLYFPAIFQYLKNFPSLEGNDTGLSKGEKIIGYLNILVASIVVIGLFSAIFLFSEFNMQFDSTNLFVVIPFSLFILLYCLVIIYFVISTLRLLKNK